MAAMQGGFDATNIPPEQGIGKHPIGKKFPAIIKMTSLETVKDNAAHGYLSVLFETPAGQIPRNYNLWNSSPQAVEIAQKQLSALCWATGIFKVSWTDEGAALRGAQLMIDVDPQTKNPEYNEVSKVYDRNGNEPGGRPAGTPQTQAGQAWGAQPQVQQPSQQPMTQQSSGSWGNNQPQQQEQKPNTSWQQNNQPNAAPAGQKPPWG